MMDLTARIDEYGKPAWLGLMILGFIVFWPVGVVILAYLIWSGRMGCWTRGGPGRWYRSERVHGCRHHGRRGHSSGNSAFDEYREETLRRLEEEQQAFQDFLDRLRQAKDKAEFDQFMAEQRNRRPGDDEGQGQGPGSGPEPAPQPQG
jgi:hypothetical protein